MQSLPCPAPLVCADCGDPLVYDRPADEWYCLSCTRYTVAKPAAPCVLCRRPAPRTYWPGLCANCFGRADVRDLLRSHGRWPGEVLKGLRRLATEGGVR